MTKNVRAGILYEIGNNDINGCDTIGDTLEMQKGKIAGVYVANTLVGGHTFSQGLVNGANQKCLSKPVAFFRKYTMNWYGY